MRAYSIRAPEYEHTSGGIRVIYGLRSWLEIKGQIVLMNAVFENKDFTGIYPEIFHGNELMANTVVRYLLNEPGVMASNGVSGPTSFAPTDKIYVFSELFNTLGVDKDHVMFLPILNMHLFKDQKRKRTKKAFFVGKGIDSLVHPSDALEIDRYFAQDQQALADLLNECQMLYVYDPVTAMTEIARLCGCPVTIIPSKYTKEQFSKYEPGMNGITWGSEEPVKLDTEAFRETYQGLWNEMNRKIELFIDDTQA